MDGGLRWGGGMATAQSSTISIGTLVLDMYDPSTKQLVWTGRATKTLDPNANQEKKQKNLDKAMQKLLKNYPPKIKGTSCASGQPSRRNVCPTTDGDLRTR